MINQVVSPKKYLDASGINIKVPSRIIICYANALSLPILENNKFTKETLWKRGDLYINEQKTLGVILKIGLGAPILSLCMHELLELGMKELIILGIAGGLTANSGDVFYITSAFACDGVSIHYGVNNAEEYKPKLILNSLYNSSINGVTVSMSAPYLENNDFLNKYSDKANCVDMETSALFVVGDRLGLKTSSYLVVNDLLLENDWKYEKDNTKVKNAFSSLLNKLIELS